MTAREVPLEAERDKFFTSASLYVPGSGLERLSIKIRVEKLMNWAGERRCFKRPLCSQIKLNARMCES
jgi:hypothetical protein